jgi:hypothetical protein
MYPDGVQKAVRTLPQYQNLPSRKNIRIKSVLLQGIIFVVIGVFLCRSAEVKSFGSAFIHMYIFFLVINTYDLIIIDWSFFCRKKVFRIAGTEHLDHEYKDYLFHFKVFIRGIVLGLVVSLIVAILVSLFIS